ncbi:hypothetical protein FBQ97_13715 [Acidobacteria bacterium ACD]|nr:MAG: hypothetical protein EDX89_04730 [Acidobacteriota bacterium]MCE7956680.1 hypothetical protein [Acidobacteria bacterium ACB2]MDL1950853.1 hypothetical protein [Acidobacteria bacterium ACD]
MTHPFEPLPHLYPFRFVDRTAERTGEGSGRVLAAVTAGGRLLGPPAASPAVLGELIAQAALLLQGGDPELGRSGFLAGLSGIEVSRLPEAGDLLTVEVVLAGRLGPVVRFDGRVLDQGGGEVARGSVTVRQGTREAA